MDLGDFFPGDIDNEREILPVLDYTSSECKSDVMTNGDDDDDDDDLPPSLEYEMEREVAATEQFNGNHFGDEKRNIERLSAYGETDEYECQSFHHSYSRNGTNNTQGNLYQNKDTCLERDQFLEQRAGDGSYHDDYTSAASINRAEANEKEENQVLENDNVYDSDGDYEDDNDDEDDNDKADQSEKSDGKMDEDDDDLTKKLLSIQVLPRIPKIKRSELSESSIPQRSVLERAEVTTKSSSYPKWPKSGGNQTDEKSHWRNDNKGKNPNIGKNSNMGQRNQRLNDSCAQVSDRKNGNAFNRFPSSNFKNRTDFEKPRSQFVKRVPCEMLFDAIMAKDTPGERKNDHEKRSSDFEGASGKPQHLDNEKRGSFSDVLRQSSKPKTLNDREASRQSDASKRNSHRHENVKSHRDGMTSERNSSGNVTKSSYDPDKHRLSSRFSTVVENGKSGDLSDNFSFSQSGKQNVAVISQNNISQESTTHSVNQNVKEPAQASQSKPSSFPSAAGENAIHTSDDAKFKRPNIQRVPRSKNTSHNTSQNGASKNFSDAASSAIVAGDIKSCKGVEEGPMECVTETPEKHQNKTLLPQFSPLSSLPVLDSSTEVIDMDVVASPLCDDKLLFSGETVTADTAAGASATSRKVVTFDCPEDAEKSRKESSKKQKGSKRDREAQRSLLETKRDIQQHVVSEMKELLRPLYSRHKINKEEYKEIMRQAVPKICHNRKSRVAQSRIKKYADRYTSHVLKLRKSRSKEAENGKSASVPAASSTCS